jgi:hypothetical protein
MQAETYDGWLHAHQNDPTGGYVVGNNPPMTVQQVRTLADTLHKSVQALDDTNGEIARATEVSTVLHQSARYFTDLSISQGRITTDNGKPLQTGGNPHKAVNTPLPAGGNPHKAVNTPLPAGGNPHKAVNTPLPGMRQRQRQSVVPATKVSVAGKTYDWQAIDKMTPAQVRAKFTTEQILSLIAAKKKRNAR